MSTFSSIEGGKGQRGSDSEFNNEYLLHQIFSTLQTVRFSKNERKKALFNDLRSDHLSSWVLCFRLWIWA